VQSDAVWSLCDDVVVVDCCWVLDVFVLVLTGFAKSDRFFIAKLSCFCCHTC
jgi:hypothetical protein